MAFTEEEKALIDLCSGVMTDDILYDCANAPVGGIEVNVNLINVNDIDVAATTFSLTNKLVVTNLQLLPGKRAFFIQGVKQIQSGASELVKKELGPDKHKHTFNGVALNFSAANKLQLQNMSEGSKYVAVLELKWKGADNKDAFQILGLKSGLELATMAWNTKENDGTVQITLSSTDGYEEPTLPLTLLEGSPTPSYALTKTAFDNQFAEA